jgi:DNA-directed RNA polymerase specialized sigma24 family protein
MSELDTQLRKLALAAQTHPPKSRERQKYLGQLISEIQQSGQQIHLDCPPDYQASYREIYDIAVQKTYQYICEKIDSYQPERGEVMGWFNFMLQKQFPNAIREIINPGKSRNWSNIPRRSLDDFTRSPTENLESPNNETISLSEEIVQCIQEDPEGLFEEKTMKSNPKVNFRWLVLKRIEGYSWEEIAQEVSVKVSAISNFYQRSLEIFKPKIKEYLEK